MTSSFGGQVLPDYPVARTLKSPHNCPTNPEEKPGAFCRLLPPANRLLLGEFIQRLIDHVNENLFRWTRELYEISCEDEPSNCSTCVDRVVAGGDPQGQFDQFLGGVGDVFGALSQKYTTGLTPKRPTREQTIQIAREFNRTIDLIRGGLAAILEWNWDERPRMEESRAESLARNVLGDISLFFSVVSKANYLDESSFCFFVPNGESTHESGYQNELNDLREALVAAERRAEDYLRDLVAARRGDLESIQKISALQHEIARLTRLTCELKAENQGLRDQHLGDGIPEAPTEAIDEAESYPVGEGKDPVEWLRTYWGHRLSYFGAPRNTLFQDQLRKFDPGLMQAIENKLKYERRKTGATPRLREIVPTKADRNSQRLATALIGLESNPDLPYVAVYRLQKKFASRK